MMATDAAQSQTPSTTTQETNDEHTLDNTGYCLLALDGGGVRGLSSLYILQNIMGRLNYLRGEAGLGPRKPCELFDLIGGTSTGGLIAIMLGRLEMTVEECIEAYLKLMSQVFEKRENRSIIGVLGGVKPRFSSAVLKDAISQVLQSRGVSLEEKFDDGTKPRCRVFVCTNLQATNTLTRLRNYRNPESFSSLNPTILEAALATSAAPTYFSDITIKGSKFVDGALGANNPTVDLEEEARDLWCAETGTLQPLVKCFISIGTGHLGLRSVSDKGFKHLVKTLEKEATQTEETNKQFISRWQNYVGRGRCFRFNVARGLEKVKLAEFEQQDLLQAATVTYLEEPETRGRVRTCVENLRLKQYQPTIEFAKRLLAQSEVQPPTSAGATASEISELIAHGTKHLKLATTHLQHKSFIQARHDFSKALHYLRTSPSTTPKQVARVCQKLLETCLGLSQITRGAEERKQHADQAQEYGETALANAVKSGDMCVAAQVDFLLGTVTAWQVYLGVKARAGDSGYGNGDGDGDGGVERENVRVMLMQRVERLRGFPGLDVGWYEGQVQKFVGYLEGV